MGTIITNINEAFRHIDGFVGDKQDQLIEAFKYAGEQFRIEAIRDKGYEDRTSNLKNSTGYLIGVDGKAVFESYGEDGGSDKNGSKLAKQILRDHSSGIVLIGVAGMKYGIHVEARGLDVITGSIPSAQQLLGSLKAQIDG